MSNTDRGIAIEEAELVSYNGCKELIARKPTQNGENKSGLVDMITDERQREQHGTMNRRIEKKRFAPRRIALGVLADAVVGFGAYALLSVMQREAELWEEFSKAMLQEDRSNWLYNYIENSSGRPLIWVSTWATGYVNHTTRRRSTSNRLYETSWLSRMALMRYDSCKKVDMANIAMCFERNRTRVAGRIGRLLSGDITCRRSSGIAFGPMVRSTLEAGAGSQEK